MLLVCESPDPEVIKGLFAICVNVSTVSIVIQGYPGLSTCFKEGRSSIRSAACPKSDVKHPESVFHFV